MTTKEAKDKPRNGRKMKAIGLLCLLAVVGTAAVWREVKADARTSESKMATFTARRGPLTISVLESGTIKARNQVILKSQVEGRSSIIFLIEEGARVKKGDKLVELDASGMVDAKIDQEISVQNAEASFISARENLAVAKNQAESDLDRTKLDLEFAKQDLRKYLEGEYPNQLEAVKQKITLVEQKLTVAEQRLEWSKKLAAEEYISSTELREDELSCESVKQDVVLAKNDYKLLTEFTYHRQIAQLESDVKQATMALERTERKALSDVAQAEADLKAKEAELSRQKDKLAKLVRQIGNAIIYAPEDGMAIYATTAKRGGHRGGNQEPLEEGQEVFERQELIYLPVGNSSTVEVDIHEASLKKLLLGLPAIITVDALPGRRFLGHLASIAPLPDSRSMWMNPDLKLYPTLVNVEDEDPALRSGMGCKVELIVAQYEDAIYVPIQAVITESGQTTVYVLENGVQQRRVVKIGLDNNRMIRILEGLDEGEVVLLEPPLKAASMDAETVKGEPNTTQGLDNNFQNRIQQSLRDSERVKPAEAETPAPQGPGGRERGGQGRSPRQGGGS